MPSMFESSVMTEKPKTNPDASIEELERMQQEIARQLEERQEQRRKEALAAINQLIEENKLDPRKVADMIASRAKRSKAPAKYRNPDNARQTWSGKGTPPEWFVNAPDKNALLIANERKKK